jgi:uncharacterized damage-inducible protein DinB
LPGPSASSWPASWTTAGQTTSSQARSLAEQITDLEGQRMRLWRFLMAMVEHEVHARSQLDCWLAAAGTEPPQLYGYRMEDVVARARRGPERIC